MSLEINTLQIGPHTSRPLAVALLIGTLIREPPSVRRVPERAPSPREEVPDSALQARAEFLDGVQRDVLLARFQAVERGDGHAQLAGECPLRHVPAQCAQLLR